LVIEDKIKLKTSRIKIPYFVGDLVGLCFVFFSLVTGKKTIISSVRVKKFCATTQFDATKAHNTFNPPYSLKEGLNNTLEYEFINPKKDKVIFYSE